ncbi:amino acid adenylation domain-containing protein [Bacillus sp. DHT2]|uniref:non-ribosomal peptide synthetase n=1 Tax=Bacillus sp. DHT2 TaxID=2994532 RepID=UPI002248E82E|nr:non-ribosomal peptide synthetase [Bacillus sp. DHT2]MCX2829791.1 amino acid adenylation domain-containing protein [Bacillus sp. DHT2]
MISKKNIKTIPLSKGQRDFFLQYCLYPDKSSYNEPFAWHVYSELDVSLVKRAFIEIINRHEIYRSIFAMEKDPVQKVYSEPFLDFKVIDIGTEELSSINQELYQESYKPFVLEKEPPFRVRLFRYAENHYIMLLVWHHIAIDGWSISLILDEFGIIYKHLKKGTNHDLKTVISQYSNFVSWQENLLLSETGETSKVFWKNKLKGEIPVLELPIDKKRPPVPSYEGGLVPFKLSREISESLLKFCDKKGFTLNTVLLSLYFAFLHRYSGQNEIIVGTPRFGRRNKDFRNTCGYFVNMLPIRINFKDGYSFEELLNILNEELKDCVKHQDYPFSMMLKELESSRDISYSPIFQTGFVLQKASRQDAAIFLGNSTNKFNLHGLTLSPCSLEKNIAKFDLTLFIEQENDKAICGNFEYNRDIFHEDTILRLIRYLEQFIASVLHNCEAGISKVNLLHEAEEKQLLKEWNNTRVEYPTEYVIQELFEQQVAQTPEAVALVYKNHQLTYKELNERANQLAHSLQKKGVGPETMVGICVERSLEMIVGLLGILKAGGAYVPLDPTYPEQRLKYILDNADIKLMVTQRNVNGWLPEGIANICLDENQEMISQASITNPIIEVAPENLAYVIYTSGSTGNPKGVLLEQKGLCNLVHTIIDLMQLNSKSRVIQFASLSFDAAVFEIFTTLVAGGTLCVSSQEDVMPGEPLKKFLQNNKITHATLPPTVLNVLDESKFEHLKVVVSAGSACSEEIAKRWSNHRIFINAYGPTEATVCATAGIYKGNGQPHIGRPISNVEVYVLDQNQQPVPIGVAGELCIGGAGLARGYLNRPELTEAAFIPHPFNGDSNAKLYRTGDSVKYLPDGNLEYIGRIDNQVKIRGFRIELGEIETVLGQHPMIKEVAVLAREDETGDKRLVAYVVGEGSVQDWREHVKAQLPNYMVPAHFVRMDALPLTINGKFDTKALPKWDSVVQASVEHIGPRNETEKKLVTIWSNVLCVEQSTIGVHDNFFELGGHSLLATQVVSRLQELFQIKLPLSELFQYSTIEGLSQRITTLLQEDKGYEIPPLQPKERGERVPLSYAQQRLWFLDQLEQNSSIYNIPTAWHLKGKWGIEALEKGYNALLRRHEVLRTVIQEINGEPMQVIKAYTKKSLQVIDLRHFSQEEKELQMKTLTQSEIETPFHLSEGPLIRTQLIIMEEEELVLLCTMHHIISDGWSMGILLDEWFAMYQAFIEEKTVQLPPLALQYADFAQWQRDWLKDEALAQQLEYWQKELSGELPVLQLPFDSPRPAVQSYKGDTYQVTLPVALLDKIKTFSREEDATLFMTLLAGYQGFLSRYTGQKDILVGSPIANRNYKEIEELIGFFVNTLVYRANLTEDLTFKELVTQVKEKALKAQEYQDVPFEKVVEVLQPERNASHSPIFQTMFTLQTHSRKLSKILDHSLEPIPNYMAVAKFDLTVGMEETEEGLQVAFEYNTDLFNALTIQRMAKHFENWLSEVMDSPQKSIGSLKLMSRGEEKQLLKEWNDTRVEYPTEYIIQELFEQQVAQTPEAVALVYKNHQLTYKELNERANQLAHSLQKKGVGPETMVGICVERSLEMIVGLLGILKAGGAYVPLDPTYPEQRLKYILDNADIKLMVTQRNVNGWLPEGIANICLDENQEMISQASITNPIIEVAPENLAYVIYTSGSTGNPKGVLLEQKGLCNLVHTIIDLMQLNSKSRVIQFASLSFDAAVFEIFTTLVAGGTLCVNDQEEVMPGEPLTKFLQNNKVTHATLPPTVLNALDESKFEHLKVVVSAGSACSEEIAKRWSNHRIFINAYGPTEATVCATAGIYEGNGQPHIGRPISNVEVYVLDQNQQPVPIGMAGELCIGGAGLARGYLNRPELTEASFIPHPFNGDSNAKLYRTGDSVKYLPDGNLEYIGRIDNQVKIRGFRIELGEIETVLGQHPMIKEVVVIAQEDEHGDKRLVAYVVGEGSVQDWREHVKAHLPNYMVPAHFVKMDALPLTINGKFDTKALLKWDRVIQTSVEHIGPRNETEKKLVTIWSGVLGIEQSTIGVHDNFFELGGHSMKIMETLVRTLSEGWNVTVKDYYELQTISKIAEKIDNGTSSYLQSNKSRIQFLKPPKKRGETEKLHQTFDQSSAVLLTGVTGYLGIHLLEQLLDTTKCKVYCLIRGRDEEEAQVRLLKNLWFYFKDKFTKYESLINERIFIVNGDLTEKRLGLNEDIYVTLHKNIKTVIHAAALTKHFGDYADFERANVKALKEILTFVGNDKKLHYVSTTSVSGQFALGEEEKVFKENDFYIKQNYEDNVYVKSKFLAEHEIFKAISKGVNANIYRVGNLTNRYRDGQHQTNIVDNAFMSRLKFMLQYGVVTNNLLSSKVEFTPVDYCSNAIIRLITSNINTDNVQEYIFHMYNHEKLELKDMVGIFEQIGHSIEVLDDSEYERIMLKISQDENRQEDLQMLMVSGEKMDERYKVVKLDSIRTQKKLEIIDFQWPEINIEYLQKIVEYMISSGFLSPDELGILHAVTK